MATFESIVDIKVVHFRPTGSVTTTTVEMELKTATSNPAPGVSTDDVVTLVGSYFIKVKPRDLGNPADGSNEMRVKFTLSIHPDNPDQNETYLLQGIAFTNRDQKKPANAKNENRLGQLDFTTIEIAGQGTNRTFTVTNNRVARGIVGQKVSYDYLFLIQRVSDGAIGIIDPEWENE